MRLKLSHFWVPIYVSLALAVITVAATFMFDNWGARHVYNIFYFTFFSFTILSLNTLFFTKHRKFLNATARKFLRILVIVVYCLIYLIATIAFLRTGQITRTQTLLFLSQMNTTIITTIIVAFIAIATILFVLLVYKKTKLEEADIKERNKIKIVFYISIILFIITVLFNSVFLQIEDPLITDKDALISYHAEILPPGERVLPINVTLEKPNIILIMGDTISAEHLGVYGDERNVTPNLDTLAKESIVFNNAYTTATHSDYAQPAILSSRYLFTSEYRTILPYDNPRIFIWDILKEDNYTTGYYTSQDDRWQNIDYYINYTNLDNVTGPMSDGVTDYGFGFANKDYDHKTTDRAIEWLNETIKKPDPFFLYMNLQAAHLPRSYPPEFSHFKPDDDSINPFADDNMRNRYDNALRYLDIQVGRIIDFTKENHISNNTIIIFLSDHGEDLEERHGITNHGKSIYNEELIVPMIMHIPGIKHTVIEDKVSEIDFTPTLIDLLGYPIPDEFQGEVMRKGRPLFFVTQSHKYLIGMMQGDIKIILDINRELSEAYNIKKDPKELKGLNTKKYKKEKLKLLFWHYCQKDYYANERWTTELTDNRCIINNNFKI